MVDWRTWRAKNHNIDILEEVRDGVYRVNGHRGIDYITNVLNYSCTCPDWQKENPTGGCKHIRAVNIAISNGDVDPPTTTPRKSRGSSEKEHLYPADWHRRSRKIKERDNRTCQNCGRSAPGTQLHVHHIVPAGKGGSHQPSNLITLCQGCHEIVHNTRFSENQSSPSAQSSNTGSERFPDRSNTSKSDASRTNSETGFPSQRDAISEYTFDGETATENTRRKTGSSETNPERVSPADDQAGPSYGKESTIPPWSGAYNGYSEYHQTATEITQEKTEVQQDGRPDKSERVEDSVNIVVAKSISIEAPAILPAEKSKVRAALRGREVHAGAYETTPPGMIEVITTNPSTSKPGSQTYVEVTSDTRIRIR